MNENLEELETTPEENEALIKQIDDATRPGQMLKISELDTESKRKVLYVGKDARFAELKEKLEANTEMFMVGDKILATIDEKNVAQFSLESLKHWMDMAKMVSDQRHTEMFLQRNVRRSGKGKNSKNHSASIALGTSSTPSG